MDKAAVKIFGVLLVLGLIGAGVFLWIENRQTKVPEKKVLEVMPTMQAISFTVSKFKETNFSGSRPAIAGSGNLVTVARNAVDKIVADFRAEADTDVPDMREKFGADSPLASYTIDINAALKEGSKTRSIILSIYTFTGGANGNNSYKVVTASKSTGKVVPLSAVIKSDARDDFVTTVKNELNKWKPEGSTVSVVFPDEVKALTFNSFSNWSIDNKNLTLYFDEGEIGPGVLGAVAFPVPLSTIKDFLAPLE